MLAGSEDLDLRPLLLLRQYSELSHKSEFYHYQVIWIYDSPDNSPRLCQRVRKFEFFFINEDFELNHIFIVLLKSLPFTLV